MAIELVALVAEHEPLVETGAGAADNAAERAKDVPPRGLWVGQPEVLQSARARRGSVVLPACADSARAGQVARASRAIAGIRTRARDSRPGRSCRWRPSRRIVLGTVVTAMASTVAVSSSGSSEKWRRIESDDRHFLAVVTWIGLPVEPRTSRPAPCATSCAERQPPCCRSANSASRQSSSCVCSGTSI
jgi:hypothetical protein